MKYNSQIVLKWFEQHGIPAVAEHRFCERKWRFDFAWPDSKVALEVQGAIFTQGRHSRGASLLKEYEKLNRAAMAGWRVLYTVPNELCMQDTIDTLKTAINAGS